MAPPIVTLANLADGAAEELFAAALHDVLANVDDVNTDPEAARQITLTFTLQPDENRRAGTITIMSRTKLAGVRGVMTRLFFGRHQGDLAAVEALKQEEMFGDPVGKPKAVEAGDGQAG